MKDGSSGISMFWHSSAKLDAALLGRWPARSQSAAEERYVNARVIKCCKPDTPLRQIKRIRHAAGERADRAGPRQDDQVSRRTRETNAELQALFRHGTRPAVEALLDVPAALPVSPVTEEDAASPL